MIDRLITIIIIVAALIAWCVLAVHYHRSMQSTERRVVRGSHSSRLSIGLSAALRRSSCPCHHQAFVGLGGLPAIWPS